MVQGIGLCSSLRQKVSHLHPRETLSKNLSHQRREFRAHEKNRKNVDKCFFQKDSSVESWSVVPCSRDLPSNAHSSFSTKTAWLTKHVENHEHDGALSWQEHIGTIQRDSPNMINGLTPYQILEKLSNQTNKDMKLAGKNGR